MSDGGVVDFRTGKPTERKAEDLNKPIDQVRLDQQVEMMEEYIRRLKDGEATGFIIVLTDDRPTDRPTIGANLEPNSVNQGIVGLTMIKDLMTRDFVLGAEGDGE